MRKGRPKKRRKVTSENALQRNTHFYPLLNGYTDKFQPVFTTASAAMCYQLSRYLRDEHYHGEVEPQWLDCVGAIEISESNLVPRKIDTRSKIETLYFRNVKIFDFSPSFLAKMKSAKTRIPSDIFKLEKETYLKCRLTFKTTPDYQSSSNSIFKTVCLEVSGNIKYVSDRTCISQSRDKDTGLISIGCNSRSFFKDGMNKQMDIDEISRKLKSAVIDTDKFIVISVCCGLGITEMESPFLCLCLDKDPRPLAAGVLAIKSSSKSESRFHFAQFNYAKGICSVLETIFDRTKLKLKVLFQHPSPSRNCKKDLKKACGDVLSSLDKKIVDSVYFVYDSSENRNSWNKDSIVRDCIPFSAKYSLTEEKMISKKGNNTVTHPIFGETKRYGWARTRKDFEYSFEIKRKEVT